MNKSLLSEIVSSKPSLNPVDTRVTTSEGEKYVERKDASGNIHLEPQRGEKGLGFCPDLTPDLNVGVALENLLVGSQDVAQDLPLLARLGITHILNVAYGVQNAFPDEMIYLCVEMFDDLQQDLLIHYPKCREFINEGRKKGKVLVHCNAGRSRSSSVALAYVMDQERVPLDAALERLKETRPCVQPNEGFMKQLRTLERNLNITQQDT